MKYVKQIFYYFKLLNIDVAIGASGLSLLVVKTLNVQLPFAYWFILSSLVWIFYTIDHIIDGRKLKDSNNNPYKFYWGNRLPLLFVIIALAGIDAVLILMFFPLKSILFGFIGSIFSGIYFFILYRFKYFKIPKEMISSLLFMLGIFIIPFSFYEGMLKLDMLVLLSLTWSTIFANIIMFSNYERKIDYQLGYLTLSRILQNSKFTSLFVLANIAASILSIFILRHSSSVAVILAILNFVNLLILASPAYFAEKGRYKVFGDLMFTLSFLILIFI